MQHEKIFWPCMQDNIIINLTGVVMILECKVCEGENFLWYCVKTSERCKTVIYASLTCLKIKWYVYSIRILICHNVKYLINRTQSFTNVNETLLLQLMSQTFQLAIWNTKLSCLY